MLYHTFTTLLSCLALASARDTGKFMKAVPTISNSLVNLGKMEIAFYFNGKSPDVPPKPDHNMPADVLFPPMPFMDHACGCNDFKPPTSPFLSDPTEIINKILKSNDLFKDPSSSLCCGGSHEHMQDNTLFIDLSPNHGSNSNIPQNVHTDIQIPNIERSPLPLPSFLFDRPGPKSKTVEILLFPKRKDIANFDITNFFAPKKRDIVLKSDLQIVGDKAISSKQPSVKKDLNILLETDKHEILEMPDEVLQTEAPPVTNSNNAL